ncbi:unnamed protein product [Phytophthora lilii]|uniref:Unnamed protein product n=1 Tax=Phytophthora lilii TaxID=2077276 RepID=A0A9W6TKJ6_9STRA|nr:unnamed protein product [Phytophthora lilii]
MRAAAAILLAVVAAGEAFADATANRSMLLALNATADENETLVGVQLQLLANGASTCTWGSDLKCSFAEDVNDLRLGGAGWL